MQFSINASEQDKFDLLIKIPNPNNNINHAQRKQPF